MILNRREYREQPIHSFIYSFFAFNMNLIIIICIPISIALVEFITNFGVIEMQSLLKEHNNAVKHNKANEHDEHVNG